MKYMKVLAHITRISSEMYIVYRIYFETGFWTCFFAFMVTCSIEFFELRQRKFNELFREHVSLHLQEEINVKNLSKTIAKMVRIRANV